MLQPKLHVTMDEAVRIKNLAFELEKRAPYQPFDETAWIAGVKEIVGVDALPFTLPTSVEIVVVKEVRQRFLLPNNAMRLFESEPELYRILQKVPYPPGRTQSQETFEQFAERFLVWRETLTSYLSSPAAPSPAVKE